MPPKSSTTTATRARAAPDTGTATADSAVATTHQGRASIEFATPTFLYRLQPANVPQGYVCEMQQGRAWMPVDTIQVSALIPFLIKAGLLDPPQLAVYGAPIARTTRAAQSNGSKAKTSTVNRT